MPEAPYTLRFPDYLEGYEVETEAKGYLAGVMVVSNAGVYDITVYDPVRLSQEIADEVRSAGHFVAANLLVVPSVTREEIAKAIATLAKVEFHGLVADSREG